MGLLGQAASQSGHARWVRGPENHGARWLLMLPRLRPCRSWQLAAIKTTNALATSQTEAIKNHLLGNNEVNPDFWSALKGLDSLKPCGLLAEQEHADQISEHVAALLRTYSTPKNWGNMAAPQSSSTSLPQATSIAPRSNRGRGSHAQAKAVSGVLGANIVNCLATAQIRNMASEN